jgi:Bacterial protein of unknown function (DUF839)
VRKSVIAALGGAIGMAAATAAIAAPGAETGPSSSQSPYMLGKQPGVETESILTVGDSVNNKPDGSTPYRMVGIPDGLGAFDNRNGTFSLLMNHELGPTSGVPREHGARGSFVSKWTIRKSDLTVLHGEDQIKKLFTWGGAAGDCSADLAPISAFYDRSSGKGYNGRILLNGEEGGTAGRAFAHVVGSGESYELTPWVGNISYENILANPNTGNKTVAMTTDDGGSSPGQQIYVYRGSKSRTGNPVEKAGLVGGSLFGIKVPDVPQYESDKTDWEVGDGHRFEVEDVSQYAGVGGTTDDGTVNTLEEDSQAKGVTNFQRPEDGAWDPDNPEDFYFVTTSSFGPRADERRDGRTRLWRLRFEDPKDPSEGGTLKLLVDGPVGTPDSPSSTGTQSAGAGGPQMLDNITVDDGKVLMQEDAGNQEYLGGIWSYDIDDRSLTEVAESDPERFTTGSPGFITKDEESSGIIPAPFLGSGRYLFDVQVHKSNPDTELVEFGQLLSLTLPY